MSKGDTKLGKQAATEVVLKHRVEEAARHKEEAARKKEAREAATVTAPARLSCKSFLFSRINKLTAKQRSKCDITARHRRGAPYPKSPRN